MLLTLLFLLFSGQHSLRSPHKILLLDPLLDLLGLFDNLRLEGAVLGYDAGGQCFSFEFFLLG